MYMSLQYLRGRNTAAIEVIWKKKKYGLGMLYVQHVLYYYIIKLFAYSSRTADRS